MKRLIIMAAAAVAVILAAVIIVVSVRSPGKPKQDGDAVEPVSAEASSGELIVYASEILKLMAADDYGCLSQLVHPDYGVVFSPSATINLSTDRRFTAAQIAGFAADTQAYIWGVYDGSGDPIKLTPAQYFDAFVTDADYLSATKISANETVMKGNALENLEEVFPNAEYVDFYIGATEGSDGLDWHSLRLVFEQYGEKLMLSAVVHSGYTI